MKKTIPISIANTLFYIEEESYTKLENYLGEIKKYFSGYEDQVDIIADIESRIREQFLQFGEDDKTERIITESQIDRLIASMGWPKEFGIPSDTDGAPPPLSEKNAKEKTRKRLYRSKSDVVVGGVASGIAAYLGIDPVIVRIVFFISMFFGGAGIFAYVVLWIGIPAAETATEILEMQGDPMNLNEVKKIVEEKIGEVGGQEKIKAGATRFFEEVRNFLVNIGGTFFKTIGGIVGVALKIASVAGIAALVALLFLALGSTSFGWGTMFTQFHSLPFFYILSVIIFLIGFIPFLFIHKLGGVFLGKKFFRNGGLASILFGIWITALIVGPALFFSRGDQYVSVVRSNVETAEIITTRDVGEFSELSVKNGNHVTVVKGDIPSIEIRGTSESIDRLLFVESAGVLIIENKPDWKFCLFCENRGTYITITTPTLSKLSLENGSKADLNIETTDFELRVQNGSHVTLRGSADTLDVMLANGSRLDATDFIVSTAIVDLANASNTSVNVANEITGELSNGSTLRQYGEGTTQTVVTNNGSTIKRVNDIES